MNEPSGFRKPMYATPFDKILFPLSCPRFFIGAENSPQYKAAKTTFYNPQKRKNIF